MGWAKLASQECREAAAAQDAVTLNEARGDGQHSSALGDGAGRSSRAGSTSPLKKVETSVRLANLRAKLSAIR